MKFLLALALFTAFAYAEDNADAISCQVKSTNFHTGTATLTCPPAAMFSPMHIEMDVVPSLYWETLQQRDLVRFKGADKKLVGIVDIRLDHSDKWFRYRIEHLRILKEDQRK